MPSSVHLVIAVMVSEILKTLPQRILDVGCGFGKYGLLSREYLEAWVDRVYPESWGLRIDAIEAWGPYIERLPWLLHVYDAVFVGDAAYLVPRLEDAGVLGSYDLVILGDVLEHMEKEAGKAVLSACLRCVAKCVLVCLPTGNWLNNTVVAGNPYEAHRSIWEKGDLPGVCGADAESFSMKPDLIHDWRLANGREGVVVSYRRVA